MSYYRPRFTIKPTWRLVLAATLCAIGIIFQVSFTLSEETRSSTASPTNKQIESWILQLESDSYATRQLAYRLLKPHPEIAIPAVERAIASVDEDAANRLVRLLAGWAAFPDDGFGRTAYAALQRIAQGGIAARSSQARRSIEVIKLTQSDIAADYLRRLSAFIDFEANDFFMVSRTTVEEHCILKIDKAFRGSIEDLDRASWLYDVESVRLVGDQIDGRWLEKIIKIPNLRMIQIRHTSITSDDLTVLYSLDRLDGLEILYTPIDDNAIDVLGSLPLSGRLRLFGTNMSAQGVEKLNAQLDGAQIMFGRGGFLGVQSDSFGGLRLTDVTSGGGAEKAGIQKYDRILTVDGKKLEKFDDLRAELAKKTPGEIVVIEYERLNLEPSQRDLKPVLEIHKVEVTLGEQP